MITARSTDRVAVDSLHQTETKVRAELTRRILTRGTISQNPENHNQLTQRIVPTFMEHAGIETWTEKAKFSAAEELRALVSTEMKKAASEAKTKTVITPVKLPIDESFTLKFKQEVLERFTLTPESTKVSTGFRKGEFHDPWTKGSFEAASFDSFSAEYRLAEILTLIPMLCGGNAIIGMRIRLLPTLR